MEEERISLEKASAKPLATVIVPCYNSKAHLEACLASLSRSRDVEFECIVVDDGSTDGSLELAQSLGFRTVSTGTRSGPARARNLGAEHASADLLIFIDADVEVHDDTIARFVQCFADEPDATAVMGSYDEKPADPGFLSQYRNLMHAFFHSTGRRAATTFWSGCGAIRKAVFLEYGGFSLEFNRPAIEDIELGYRLKSGGHRLMLDRDIQVTHRKRWTFWQMVKTDVFDRAIPWTELIFTHGRMPNDLNLRYSQRLSVLLVCAAVLTAVFAAFEHGTKLTLPLMAIFFAVLNTYWIERATRRPDLVIVLTLVASLGVSIYFGGTQLGSTQVILLAGIAYALLAMRYLHAYENLVSRKITGFLYGVFLAVLIVAVAMQVPASPIVGVLAVMLLTVLVLNWRFYHFLASNWGKLYALAAIPFHLLYYLYSGVAFILGFGLYLWKRVRPSSARAAAGN
jgi:glycosyltransferase involved in cell wall biosynthesis